MSTCRFRVIGASRWKGNLENGDSFDGGKFRVLEDMDSSRNSPDSMKWGQDAVDLKVSRRLFGQVEHLLNSLPMEIEVTYKRFADGKGGFKEQIVELVPVSAPALPRKAA